MHQQQEQQTAMVKVALFTPAANCCAMHTAAEAMSGFTICVLIQYAVHNNVSTYSL